SPGGWPAIPPPPPSLASRGERATAAPGGRLGRITGRPGARDARKRTCHQPVHYVSVHPSTMSPCNTTSSPRGWRIEIAASYSDTYQEPCSRLADDLVRLEVERDLDG